MTTNKSTESNQEDASNPSPPPPPAHPQYQSSRGGNTIFKSGPLFISSKGIGWTSWKKRWFILTRTSLVFFRSDPNSIPQKGGEVNLTLGGIDLNNSGSVAVKADKKLLTVLFPDGRDGRAFTLKAETSEDLYEWRTALENALAQAPSTCLVTGQNGICRSEEADGTDGCLEQSKDKQPVKSFVIGRPILVALEDVDGSPSFLEKALRFIEDHGSKVEGILRQAADVDNVEHRIREYEQGKTEFSPGEDAHVIADCVKYFLRELPSSPVPASCCSALVEACRADRGNRVNAMRVSICETFPEPNRRLLQRILLMMLSVASHKAENRMSTAAVAACMAPLLLRPLLAGECEIDSNINVGGDGSIQLLKAAAAANHAQAIVITLLEEYDNIFNEASMTPGLYSDSDGYGSEDEELTDDEYYEDEQDYTTEGSDAYTDDDLQNESSGTCTESGDSGEGNLSDTKDSDHLGAGSMSPEVDNDLKAEQKFLPSSVQTSMPFCDDEGQENISDKSNSSLAAQKNDSDELLGSISEETVVENKLPGHNPPTCIKKSTTISNGPVHERQGPHVWRRTPAKKNLSMESIDFTLEDEYEIQKLEACKIELQNKISEEIKRNGVLHAELEQRQRALHERRLVLEQDVARLQELLQKERKKRIVLESCLETSIGPLPVSVIIDEKMKAELEEIFEAEADVANLTKKVFDLDVQLNQQREQNCGSVHDSSHQPLHASTHQAKRKDKQRDSEAAAAAAASQLGRSSSKDTYADVTKNEKCKSTSPKEHPPTSLQLDVTENEKEKKHELVSSPKKNLPVNQQLDPASSSNFRPSASANSKKSGTRSEDNYADVTKNEKYKSVSSPKQHPPKSQQLDVTESENEKKHESTSSPNKHLPINQQLDSACSSNSWPGASANSKRSGARSEDTYADVTRNEHYTSTSSPKQDPPKSQQLDVTESENEEKHELTSSPKKNLLISQQHPAHSSNSWPSASANYKKSSMRNEDPYTDVTENVKYKSMSSPRQYPPKSQQLDATESENEKKLESTSSPKKYLPTNQQLDPPCSSNSWPTASANSKKSGTRNEYNYDDVTENEKYKPTSSPKQHPPGRQQLDVTENEDEKMQESTSSPRKHKPIHQQLDPARSSNSRRISSANSKKSGTRSEGVNSTSALTKLTTRLNFLKERRSQIASELQNLDKGRGGSGHALHKP